MKTKTVLLIVTLITVILSISTNVGADYGGVTLSAWTSTPPVIDGDMNTFPGEWGTADSHDFVADNDVSGTFYVMNDETNLYIFLKHEDQTGYGSVCVYFDNDNDEIEWEDGDDGICYMNNPGGGFRDKHYSSWPDDTSQDGMGEMGGDASYQYYEFSHPLSSGDPEDFSLIIGDIVGFQLKIDYDTIGYWPSQAQTTNDILIAGPPMIGGEILPFNPMPVSLTLIMAILSILIGGSIYKNRKQ
jgi:hypothetical protein